ncbi:hypothetical protein QFZ24_005298 [Streptomyces phaeochromogenes]|uniref:hypothetical protein n=1 Tax=Streptomyces phaeochromogenes TaxID=1923 RepID=UPI00278ED9CD|nr:hypothetical protein [Streptomyces phaeochromogenes]MDQ0951375.1 hypothetical protein [Streptomyces phaeochromogenes]
MGNPGGGPDDEAERVSRLVGELLIGLGEKVRAAGPESVRVLTDEELQRHQLNWFRAGWDEHARATGGEGDPAGGPAGWDGQARPGSDVSGHPDTEDFPVPPSARLLRFPERPPDDEGGGLR